MSDTLGLAGAARSALDGLKLSADEQVGVNIVRRAIEDPCRWIASNAGWKARSFSTRCANGKGAFGFGRREGRVGGPHQGGIVDPIKVVRTGLQNAASVAGMLLTTEALIAEKPEEKSAPPRPCRPAAWCAWAAWAA
jgi:chaperonin GroEL